MLVKVECRIQIVYDAPDKMSKRIRVTKRRSRRRSVPGQMVQPFVPAITA